MVVRVASRILSPDAYARVETRVLPAPGEYLEVPSGQGRVTFLVGSVEQGEGEPILRVAISEDEAWDPHFGRPIGDLFAPDPQPTLVESDAPPGP